MTKEELIDDSCLSRVKQRSYMQSATYQISSHEIGSSQMRDFSEKKPQAQHSSFNKKQIKLSVKSTRNHSLSSHINLLTNINELDKNNNLLSKSRKNSSAKEASNGLLTNASNSNPNKERGFILTVVLFFQNQSQFLTLSLFIVISILTNSLYFNFYYLPSLTRLHSNQPKNHLEKIEGLEPRLPYLSYLDNKGSLKNEHFKSFEHVAFASLDSHSQEQKYQQSPQINSQLDKDLKQKIFDSFNADVYKASSIGFDEEKENLSINKSNNYV